MCCDWLHSVMQGEGHVAPPISVRACTAVAGCGGCMGGMYLDCVHLEEISFAAQVVTGAPNSGVLSGYCLFSLTVTGSDCWEIMACFVVPACSSGDARGSRPVNDRSGVHFRNELQTSWNAPMSFVNLSVAGRGEA